jgi:cystathionine beta-lyase
MSFNFDQIVERRGSGSAKWEYFPGDVLPMWVADMDFRSPEPVIRALHARVEHGMFGYSSHPARLAETICARMASLYDWQVDPEQIVFVPSLVSAMNIVCRAIGEPGDSVLTLTPAYPPFLSSPPSHQRVTDTLELQQVPSGRTFSYKLDLDAFAGAIHERTRVLMLCNPHNPIGYEYTPAELRGMAEICLEKNVVICSDEIHCDLLLGGTRHVPLASLGPEIADRTITLMSPSKTFNQPGLGCAVAIIANPELRKQFQQASYGIVPHVNALGLAATQAAFSECEPWLAALREYLTANRDLMVRFVSEQMPQLTATVPQATYLGWLDCRASDIPGSPFTFFLEQAKVGFSDGAAFGPGGQGFVRINFGCPRALLVEGLERMRAALDNLDGPSDR